jgi:hypothetical protein
MSIDIKAEVYDELCKDASRTVRSSLEKIKNACESQVNGNSKDFSYAVIGRISEANEGVTALTIGKSTKNGTAYRKLIDVYATVHSRPVGKKEPKGEAALLSRIKRMEDATARNLAFDLMQENRALKNELNILKGAKTIDIDLRTNKSQSSTPLLDNVLDKRERESLNHFISQNNLKEYGWTISDSGAISDMNGRKLTRPGFVQAIEKLNIVVEE